MKIKLVSWNIWQSKYIDRVIEQIKELNPDVIALQEVTESQGINSGQVIAEKLGYNHFFCQSADAQSRIPPIKLGNSVLSKYNLSESKCQLLSTADEYEHTTETEPRVAVQTTITLSNEQLHVINTHLGYSEDLKVTAMQKKQLQTLLSFLPDKNVVLAGDFNCLPESEVVQDLEKKLINVDPEKTVPTRFTHKEESIQKDRIDYIFVSADVRFSEFTIHQTSASDHTPLSVVIEF